MAHGHSGHSDAEVLAELRASIARAIPDAVITATGGGGHYTLEVVSPAFAGRGMVDAQRMVYSAIAHLMKGDDAPVHAVDSLRTRTP